VFALLAGLCWLSARFGRLMTARATGAQPAPAGGGSLGLLVKVLPYLTVVIAAFAPLAAGIYLLTSLAWSLAERMLWRNRLDRSQHRPRSPRPEVPSGAAQLPQSASRRRRAASVE
jgi:hypothetical protein